MLCVNEMMSYFSSHITVICTRHLRSIFCNNAHFLLLSIHTPFVVLNIRSLLFLEPTHHSHRLLYFFNN